MSTWKWPLGSGQLNGALAALLFLFSGAVQAEPNLSTPAPTINPIQTVIQSQIAALQADNFEVAFSFAAPNIQRLFGSPRRFAEMIVSNYPMVWRPANVQYLSLTRSGPYALQRVMITDQQNNLHILLYQLEPVSQNWRISGVQILALPGERI